MASQIIRSAWTFVLYTLLGVLSFLCILLIATLLVPIYVYRWLIKRAAPVFNSSIGNAVTSRGQFFATEFTPISGTSPPQLPMPRCTIITRVYVSGHIPFELLTMMITKHWLTPKPGQTSLKYPEFQQYIQKWMGFMFWWNDSSFSIKNHISCRVIPESSSPDDCEAFLQRLVQHKLNSPFTPKRSPWEMILVQNVKTSSGEPVSVVLCRFHHAMVDGFSVLSALMEGLGANAPPPLPPQVPRVKASIEQRLWRGLLYKPWRTVYDMGYFLKLNIQYNVFGRLTPWHAPDSDKTWKHVCSRSEQIPLEKMKLIKNKLGVTFTSVILSCFGAAASRSFKSMGYKGRQWMPAFTALPIPNHPDKLRNYVTGAFLELPTSCDLSSVERLHLTDQKFKDVRHASQVPFLTSVLNLIFSSPVASLAKTLCTNRIISGSISNFPGPGVQIEMLGNKVISMDFVGGGLLGVNGVSIGIVSYYDHIRVTFEAEQCIVDEQGMALIVRQFMQELESLHQLAHEKEYFV